MGGLAGFRSRREAGCKLDVPTTSPSRDAGAGESWVGLEFAVLMAGRAPIVSLDPDVFRSSMLSNPSQIELSGPPELGDIMGEKHVLKLPTIHVYGLADPGLHFHRELLDNYCSFDSARILEWNGAHRVPLKSGDVNPLIEEILNLAKEIGAL